MMRTYSHVRRIALDAAAQALEPPERSEPEVKSQGTSQEDETEREMDQISSEFGSSGWTRTSNPPVNRFMQV